MIRQIRNINLIFWGMLIVIFDFSLSSTTNGYGIKFNIINDFVGSILIFIGLSKISKIKLIDTSFKSKMNYGLVASFILYSLFSILYSISFFFIYPAPEYISTIKNLLDIAIDWGFVTFSGAMIVLTTETHLNNSLRRWITTKKLFIWIYFLPFAALTFISEMISLINTYRYN